MRPILPVGGVRGSRWNDHRKVINGAFYRARTGVPWRDLPERFGHWVTVYKRHRRWSEDGRWARLPTAVQAGGGAEGLIDWRAAVGLDRRAGAPACRGSTPRKGESGRTKRSDRVRAIRRTGWRNCCGTGSRKVARRFLHSRGPARGRS
ncbi:transposase [Actinocorallia populi]|uniref:transposase n=1 Tax=Actinocorallia populi TaxID=2079200 RepID=UPI000D090598